MQDLTIQLSMFWVITIIVGAIMGLVAGGAIVAHQIAKATNKQRDNNWLPFCEKASQNRIATLEAQVRADAKLLVEKGREIIDLNARIAAGQNLAKQTELALTPGIDIAGRA
jgi:hypothetical protein